MTRARRDSGLSITDVSNLTQIRPNVVDCIEHDDFSACSDDIEARAEIRAIAEAIGLPAEPLVNEYEATGPIAPAPATEPLPAEEPTEPIPVISADEPAAAEASYPGEPAYADQRAYADESAYADEPAYAGQPAYPAETAGLLGAMSASARRARGNAFVLAGAGLLVVAILGGCLLAFGIGGSATPQASPTSGHRGHGTSQAPSGHSPARHSRKPSAAKGHAHVLRPARVTAFGPGGVRDGDHPQLAHLVLRGHGGWHSSWYASPHFGNLQSGTGLVLDMGHEVTVRAVRIVLGNGQGANLEIRVGNVPTLSRLRPVARATGAARTVRMHAKPRHGRYVLIWFTRLPADHAGTFQASVYNVTLLGSR
ncbi:MAG: helix-turn-helix domain-containing protein [Streptosporangiaceae bacterium]